MVSAARHKRKKLLLNHKFSPLNFLSTHFSCSRVIANMRNATTRWLIKAKHKEMEKISLNNVWHLWEILQMPFFQTETIGADNNYSYYHCGWRWACRRCNWSKTEKKKLNKNFLYAMSMRFDAQSDCFLWIL